MLRKGGGSFAFFITSPRKEEVSPSVDTPMFAFPEPTKEPYSPDITLFGSMTTDECKMLAFLIYSRSRVKMRIPDDFDHPRFHGDILTLTFDELMRRLEGFVGNLERLPRGSILSMGAFFDYLREHVLERAVSRSVSRSVTPKIPLADD